MEPRSQLRHHRPPHAVAREDCWSDGATEALVEAWGERYVSLGRGNLRQKDWQEVADAVNAHQAALGRPRRTDVQCKNRVDTLKKKYKSEKAKRGPSLWPFFSRLQHLISDPAKTSGGNGAGPAAIDGDYVEDEGSEEGPRRVFGMPEFLRRRRHADNEEEESDEVHRRAYGSAEVPRKRKHADYEDEGSEESLLRAFGMAEAPRKRKNAAGDRDEAFGELARAIVTFGEIYERVEGMKQRQMMEMERKKMEFAKELEFQRMQVFMEAQLELQKISRTRCSDGPGEDPWLGMALFWSLFMATPAAC